jgi:hypothetical protein
MTIIRRFNDGTLSAALREYLAVSRGALVPIAHGARWQLNAVPEEWALLAQWGGGGCCDKCGRDGASVRAARTISRKSSNIGWLDEITAR